VLTTSGTYPWSLVTQLFRNRQLSIWWRSYNFRRDDFKLANNNPWFISFFVSNNPLFSEDWLRRKLYDTRDHLNFLIVNFPFICNNIPSPPIYGVYISLLLRYPSGCGSCQYFLNRGLLLTRTLMNQGLLLVNLKSSLRKLYDRHHILS
jgi:hypothetical protein